MSVCDGLMIFSDPGPVSKSFGLFFTAKIRVLCGEWVGIKTEGLKKMVYDRLKSLVGLWGERVLLGDYSQRVL